MRERSDDLSHHKRTLYHGATSHSFSEKHSLCYTICCALAVTRNRSTMRERSDDLSHHKRTLYHGATSHSFSEKHSLCYISCGALAVTRNRSTMRDRSDDLSHHKRTLYHGATSLSVWIGDGCTQCSIEVLLIASSVSLH